VHYSSYVGVLRKDREAEGKLDVRNHVKLTVCNHRLKGDTHHEPDPVGSTSAMDSGRAPSGCSTELQHDHTHSFLAAERVQAAVESASSTVVDWRKFSDGDKLCKQLKDIEKKEDGQARQDGWRDEILEGMMPRLRPLYVRARFQCLVWVARVLRSDTPNPPQKHAAAPHTERTEG
jgi:hypothetical protein